MENKEYIEKQFGSEVQNSPAAAQSVGESYIVNLPTAEVHLTNFSDVERDVGFDWKWVVTGATPKEKTGSPEWNSGEADNIEEACGKAKQAVWNLTEKTRKQIDQANKQIQEDLGYLIARSERIENRIDSLERTIVREIIS